MSTVHSDARLDPASLTRHVGLEDVRHGGQGATAEVQAPDIARAPLPRAEPALDFGETLLNADAWGDVPTGERMLGGDRGFEAQLAALDLSQAADSAANAIADAFA